MAKTAHEKPNCFLIVKEPPFADSYNKAVYIHRVLDELVPQYKDVRYEFVVRGLPETPADLNSLISGVLPDALFDKTIISPFDDTDGGKGILVWIYQAPAAAPTIEVDASSVEEGREKIKSKVPSGFHVHSEKIISDGAPEIVRFVADTVEAAAAKAEAQLPSGKTIVDVRTVAVPGDKAITVDGFDEEGARKEAALRGGRDTTVKHVKVAAPGKKGFLGIGKKPNRYECVIVQQAVIEVKYMGKARLVAELAEGVGTKIIEPIYPAWMTSRMRIPSEGRRLRVDGDCEVVPIDEFSCPVCGYNFGDDLPSSGRNVIVRFRLDWGAYFWWSVVSHCGKKLLISNRGM